MEVSIKCSDQGNALTRSVLWFFAAGLVDLPALRSVVFELKEGATFVSVAAKVCS
jgi:hypothetical protein